MAAPIRTFILMGRPGSGKGTQAKLLVDTLGFDYFATGDAFRSLAKQDTPLGKRVEAVVTQGYLMPHWFASYLVNDRILNVPDDRGIVFDGTNRTLPEAELFWDVTQWLGRPYRVFYLDVSVETIVERILQRGKTSGRSDDTRESIETRIAEYDRHTQEALAFLDDKGLVERIRGDRQIEEIQSDIRDRASALLHGG